MPRWALALILIAGVGLLYVGYRVGAPARKPNVVFLVLDTLRHDRLGATRNGVPIAPFLTEFAKGGANFSHAIAPSSWTKPTLASLFTATYPDTHKVRFSVQPGDTTKTSDVLAAGFETLPEAFAAAGYDNWGFQTNENGSEAYGFAQGFAQDRYKFLNFVPAEVLTTQVLDTLPQLKPPFFLFAQYIDPHAPYDPPADYTGVFGPPPQPDEQDAVQIDRGNAAFWRYFYDDVDTWLGRQLKRTIPPLSEVGKEAIRYRYDAEVRAMDDQLARLVRTIEGEYPDTIFVLVSDHGEEFWERGTMGHSHQVYEELVHVPMILRGPGVPSGEVQQTVGTIGVWPSLAKLAGLPVHPQWQVPGLFEQAERAAPVYTWTRGSYNDGLVHVEAMVDGALKLMNSPVDNDPATPDPTHAETQLFDLEKDPGEKSSLYPRTEAEDIPLLAKLERHREATARAGESIASTETNLSPERMKQLEELGYPSDAKQAPAATPAASSAMNEQLEALGYLGGGDEEKAAAPAPPAKPNVLLVVVDTLRADRVAAARNGVPVMPKLHAFAKQSVWFTQAIAQASWTKPSVTSILTGLYTQTHGVQFGVQRPWVEGQKMTVQGLAPEKPTILSWLKGAGYSTAALQTNVHMQAAYGFAQGCDDYHYARWASATQVTNQALARAASMQPPFMLYAHYFDPHADYAPPEPHRSAFGPLPALTPEEDDLLHNDYHQRYYLEKAKLDMGLIAGKTLGDFSETGREHVRQLYDGECNYTDMELARLFSEVRTKWPNTIIVLTSDHGEEFWEHGGIGHAKTVYQEVVNIPLIVSAPGISPREVATPVENIDIAPTLAGLLGLPPDPDWQGRNVLAEPLPPAPGLHRDARFLP
jgi:arylsulfatase A-like enzyme